MKTKKLYRFSIFVEDTDGTKWGAFNSVQAAENFAIDMLPYGTYSIVLINAAGVSHTAYKVEVSDKIVVKFF